MYRKNVQGWMKHWDFILLDILCMNAAFVIACILRKGLYVPYSDRNDLQLAVLLTVVDLIVLIVGQTMKNVLRRGWYLEFARTVQHVLVVELAIVFYLFATRNRQPIPELFW